MEKFLSDDEIINIVKEYIDDINTDYAIMIDGEWGSGKTYFLEKILQSKLENEYEIENKNLKFIYVSAYGVKLKEELDNKIYEKIIIEFFPKSLNKKYKDIEKGIGSIYNIISEFSKFPHIPTNSIRSLIELLQKRNMKQYILIIDDLERAEMPIPELLGYVNEFVEHKSMKTIIVANEKEILKKKMHSNIELKYLVTENELLDIPNEEKDISDIFRNTKKEDVQRKIGLKELNNRVEKLFGEDIIYNQIKEKLIGLTIYYKPNLEVVFKNILKDYVEDERVKKYLEENEILILRIMNNRNYINIRTLKIALNYLNLIFRIIFDMDLSEYNEQDVKKMKKDILIYTLDECIKYKEGKCRDINKSEIFYISQESSFNESTNKGFRFVDDLIKQGYIDKDRVNKVIYDYIILISSDDTSPEDPINILSYYWEISDAVIEKNFNLLKEKLSKNQYKSKTYSKIMYLMIKIVGMGFPQEYIEEIKNLMLKNVTEKNNIKDYNAFDELDFIFENDEEKEEYERNIKIIKENISVKSEKDRKDNLNTLINKNNGWGYEFSQYCIKNKGTFVARKEFFNLIDIDNLVDNIRTSDTKEISDFRRCIATIYNFRNINEFYKNDIDKLLEFLEKLETIDKIECEKYDRSKKYNIELIKKQVKNIVEILNK